MALMQELALLAGWYVSLAQGKHGVSDVAVAVPCWKVPGLHPLVGLQLVWPAAS